jgi:aspartokinase
MIVAKFGGTSVGDAPAIERAAGIIRDRVPRQPLVVVSALGGTTNALIALAEQASSGQLILAIRGVWRSPFAGAVAWRVADCFT